MYLFGQKNQPCSIHYAEHLLTEQQKSEGVYVEILPIKPEKIDGFEWVLSLDENRQPYYAKVDISNQIEDAKKQAYESGQNDLLTSMIEGGLI